MKTCARCIHLTEVVGGSQLVNFCKEKNEPVEFPTLMGRFCKSFKEVEENGREIQSLSLVSGDETSN